MLKGWKKKHQQKLLLKSLLQKEKENTAMTELMWKWKMAYQRMRYEQGICLVSEESPKKYQNPLFSIFSLFSIILCVGTLCFIIDRKFLGV